MKEAFPSPTERVVASALLLLSTSPPTNARKMMERIDLSCSKSKKTSSSSSATTTVECDRNRDRDRSKLTVSESRSGKLKAIAAFVVRFHDMKKLKVVRKKRSKSLWISDGRKLSSGKPAEDSDSVSATASSSSCLTSISGGASSAGSGIGRSEIHSLLKKKPTKVDGNGNVVCSAHLRRRAEAIMKVLASHGCASEVRIRQLLGDSPDTSKALRLLLKREEVKRRGAGGRSDPYIYMIARRTNYEDKSAVY